MLEIIYITQVGIQIAHHPYYSPGRFVAFFPVLDGLNVIHHLLNVPAIFRQDQLLAAGIIIVSHSDFFAWYSAKVHLLFVIGN